VAQTFSQTEPASRQSSLAVLRRLEWRVQHAVRNILSGEYRSTFKGRGMEFDQVVRYEYGDDVRDIDWNVTARLGEPYRKKYVEEREITLLLLFEDSPSLQFGSGEVSKREVLMELAGLVMLLSAINRDRIGYVHVTPKGFTFREPVRGHGAIMHSAATLLGRPAPAIGGEPSGIPWRFLAQAAPKHSVLIWLGDFPPRAEPDGWQVIQRRYQTMGFRAVDPWERELPSRASLTTFDPGAGRLVTLDDSPAEREAQRAWCEEREASFRTHFPDTLSQLTVGTDENRLDAMVRFFHARMRSR